MDKAVQQIILTALKEDGADRDITSRFLIEPDQKVVAQIIAKQSGIVCGTAIAQAIFRRMDSECKIKLHVGDRSKIVTQKKIMTVEGLALKLLASERTALNFLQHLSGVATLTKKFVDAVKGTKAEIYDTRKTIPGLRLLQKYAVVCGGGVNHRMGLSDMVLVKDNHLKIVEGSMRVKTLKQQLAQKAMLQIEAKNMREVKHALDAKADVILLDNMSLSQIKKAIHFIRSFSHRSAKFLTGIKQRKTSSGNILRPLIEVSGGVSLRNVHRIARLGPDRISIGAITHSAPALDISMEIHKE